MRDRQAGSVAKLLEQVAEHPAGGNRMREADEATMSP